MASISMGVVIILYTSVLFLLVTLLFGMVFAHKKRIFLSKKAKAKYESKHSR